MFNEVFLDDVFVPDDCVIGEVNGGWSLARMTLANERVSMSSGSTFGIGVESLLRLADRRSQSITPSLSVRLGRLLSEAQSLRLMTHRSTLLALAGSDPGPQASLRKLLGAEHEQRVQEMGLSLYGAEGATMDGSAARWAQGFLATRCLTIAGGTSEVQRNVIAERLLGQPRDPEPGS
jgi:alkylation response protein AidB-like acyl-CoA dehydrogenase